MTAFPGHPLGTEPTYPTSRRDDVLADDCGNDARDYAAQDAATAAEAARYDAEEARREQAVESLALWGRCSRCFRALEPVRVEDVEIYLCAIC